MNQITAHLTSAWNITVHLQCMLGWTSSRASGNGIERYNLFSPNLHWQSMWHGQKKITSPWVPAITLHIIVFCTSLQPPGVQMSLRPSSSDGAKMKKRDWGLRAEDVREKIEGRRRWREKEIMLIRRQRQTRVLEGRWIQKENWQLLIVAKS